MRKTLFWTLDFLKGNSIKQNYRQIESILRDPFGSVSNETREKIINKLLNHTVTSVPFYRNQKFSDLYDFPVIRKSKIQNDFQSFRSQEYLEKKLFKVSTSGSTGVPFMLYHNNGKRKRNTADVLYFLNKTGYKIGNRLIELEVWRNHNRRSAMKNFLQNSEQFDISKLTEVQIEKFLNIVYGSRRDVNILGFASALETICQYLDTKPKGNKSNKITGIIANSEYLNDYTRNAASKHFDAPIYSRYSNEELGIMAHQTDTSGAMFEINWASYAVEILDFEKDIPVPNGERGRLVVTDLFNYSMPLIRYDTGDIAMFHESDKRFLKVVEGRKMDMVYDTKGNVISSYVIYTKFYPYYNLLNQYQFIQAGEKDYIIKLNTKAEFTNQLDLIKSVKEDFGTDAKVTIEYVDEIPPLSSGKRKKVVNMWSN